MGRDIEHRDRESPGDEVLVHRWARGDREAGAALLRRYFQMVYTFFSFRAPSEAEDLAQRTFLACAEALPRYRNESSFRAFLLGIARHQLLKGYERGGVVQRLEHLVAGPESATTPTSRLSNIEGKSRLLAAIEALPLDAQLVLELHYWEGWSTHEIADVLGIGREAVKIRLFRARQRLKADLASDDIERQLTEITRSVGFRRWSAAVARAVEERRD